MTDEAAKKKTIDEFEVEMLCNDLKWELNRRDFAIESFLASYYEDQDTTTIFGKILEQMNDKGKLSERGVRREIVKSILVWLASDPKNLEVKSQFWNWFKQGIEQDYFDDKFIEDTACDRPVGLLLYECAAVPDWSPDEPLSTRTEEQRREKQEKDRIARLKAYVQALERCSEEVQMKFDDQIVLCAIQSKEYDSAFYALMRYDENDEDKKSRFNLLAVYLVSEMWEDEARRFLNYPFGWKFEQWAAALAHGNIRALMAASAMYNRVGEYGKACQALYDVVVYYASGIAALSSSGATKAPRGKGILDLKAKKSEDPAKAVLEEARMAAALLHSMMKTRKVVVRDGSGAIVSLDDVVKLQHDIRCEQLDLQLPEKGHWTPTDALACVHNSYHSDMLETFCSRLAQNQVTDAKDEFLYDSLELLENEKLLPASSELIVAACAIRSSTGEGQNQQEVTPSAWIKEYALRRNLKFVQMLPPKEQKRLIVGPPKAGKTTLLHRLKTGEFVTDDHTKTDHNVAFTVKNVNYYEYDLQRERMASEERRKLLDQVKAVVFMVNAADKASFPLAKERLHDLLQDGALQSVSFLILGNKIDHSDAVSQDTLCRSLGLTGSPDDHVVLAGQRTVGIYMCSVKAKEGYIEGLRWLKKGMA